MIETIGIGSASEDAGPDLPLNVDWVIGELKALYDGEPRDQNKFVIMQLLSQVIIRRAELEMAGLGLKQQSLKS